MDIGGKLTAEELVGKVCVGQLGYQKGMPVQKRSFWCLCWRLALGQGGGSVWLTAERCGSGCGETHVLPPGTRSSSLSGAVPFLHSWDGPGPQ